MSLRKNILLVICLVISPPLFSQVQVGGENTGLDYVRPKQYVIGGIEVTGPEFLDKAALKTLSGLFVGDTIAIPGEKIAKALDNFWKQELFSDVKIVAQKIEGNRIFLEFKLQEKPRLSTFSFKGDVSKADEDKIKKKINLEKGQVITGFLVSSAKNMVRQYYVNKGYLNTVVTVEQHPDTIYRNSQALTITVDKKEKVKIERIIFHGVKEIKESRLRRAMQDTKEKRGWKIFTSSRFIRENYEKDKANVITEYADHGFKDAHITHDTVYTIGPGKINIEITISEGRKYYFRNITWVGNTKYSSDTLSIVLGIKKGDVYEQPVLDQRLYMNLKEKDITSLYMDNGYLFFRVTPVEINAENDSIDLEMRIHEGKQATVNKVTLTGNTKTHDHVIMREIRTRPGQLFNRSDILRTERELAQLPYLNPEKLEVNPNPNSTDGTVDIEYVVEEKRSDKYELSGGYSGEKLVGALGLELNNFSLRNIFRGGDGQRLRLRGQTNGRPYWAVNVSFTEPWLGGKKPNPFNVSFFHSVQTNGRKKEDPLRESMTITGGSVGYGKKLSWPDNYFSIYGEAAYLRYVLDNFSSTFLFDNGTSNDLSLMGRLSRNSINHVIYPSEGSRVSLSCKFTLPYSLFSSTDFKTAPQEVKYKWIEYYKWKFGASWFTSLDKKEKLVLRARVRYGFLGYYNSDIGASPFQRFYMGGDGLSGFTIEGRDIIALRGYDDITLTPANSSGYIGGTVFEKYTLEMRYPLSLNPHATIYVLGFVEGGDDFLYFKDFNPFKFKRSAGLGIRVFIPIFGLIGLDWGYGFDDVPGSLNPNQIHFYIGYEFDED